MMSSSAGTLASKPTPAPRQSRDELVDQLTGLLPAMRRVFEVRLGPEQRAAWRPLTVHQLEALVVLDRSSVTMRELCDELDISDSAGSALSDRLVAAGLVERCSDSRDRRVVRLSMSQQARSMAEQYRSLKHRQVAKVLAVLDARELELLLKICKHLADGIDQTGDSADPKWTGAAL